MPSTARGPFLKTRTSPSASMPWRSVTPPTLPAVCSPPPPPLLRVGWRRLPRLAGLAAEGTVRDDVGLRWRRRNGTYRDEHRDRPTPRRRLLVRHRPLAAPRVAGERGEHP